MNQFTVTQRVNTQGVKIVVIGVGGGGSNMLESLVDSDIADKVKLVTINTDAQALASCKVPYKLQIGEKLTKGKGAGMKPEIGRGAALENYEEIKELFTKF